MASYDLILNVKGDIMNDENIGIRLITPAQGWVEFTIVEFDAFREMVVMNQKINALDRPANTVFLMENWRGCQIVTQCNGGPPNGNFTSDGGSWTSIQWPHNDGQNAAYADGHVKWNAKNKGQVWWTNELAGSN